MMKNEFGHIGPPPDRDRFEGADHRLFRPRRPSASGPTHWPRFGAGILVNERARAYNSGMLLSWLILSFAVWLTARILPGFRLAGFGDAVVVAAIFGLLNLFIGWLLF